MMKSDFFLFGCCLFVFQGEKRQTVHFQPVRKKMGELLRLCTFSLCICLTVLHSIYLTGHAYVCGQERKEFGESRKGSYNPLTYDLIYEFLFCFVLFLFYSSVYRKGLFC